MKKSTGILYNVIYVKDSPKYRLTEQVRFCGLGLRTLVFTEASVQRVEKGRHPAWLGDFTFLSHLQSQTRLISKRAAAILSE